MVAPDGQDPQVILIVAEADLVSDFQQRFAARGVTVRFAEDPTAVREAVTVQCPRLVILPVEGACQVLLEAWAESGTPVELVMGLVEQQSDPSKVPKSVTRAARKGNTQEIISLAELMMRSSPVAKKPVAKKPVAKKPVDEKPVEVAASIWNKPGGILKNLDAQKLVDEEAEPESEEDVDFDPSRVSDIRSLGVAVRMAKAIKATQNAPAQPDPALSLNLSHADGDEDDETGDKPAGITDAMSLLPQARAAESEEETIARLAAERAAESVIGQPVERNPTAPPMVLEPAVVVRKSRKGLILVVVAVLVLAGGGVAAFLLLRSKPKSKSGPSAPVTKVKKPARTKRGVYEDHFAGTIAQLPKTVTALDVDVSDEFLNRSVPELNPYMEQALRRLSRSKRRKTLMEQGLKLLGWERYPEARRFLKQAVELKEGPKARAALSRAYEGLGRNWAAIVHLRHAIKRDKKNDAYHARLGLLYLREEKPKKGCRFLKRAAKLKKSHQTLVEKHCGKGKGKRKNRRRKRRRRRR